MNKRKVPVEIVGYRNAHVFMIDDVRGTFGYRWLSMVNDDEHEDDFLPWDGDSSPNDCPF